MTAYSCAGATFFVQGNITERWTERQEDAPWVPRDRSYDCTDAFSSVVIPGSPGGPS